MYHYKYQSVIWHICRSPKFTRSVKAYIHFSHCQYFNTPVLCLNVKQKPSLTTSEPQITITGQAFPTDTCKSILMSEHFKWLLLSLVDTGTNAKCIYPQVQVLIHIHIWKQQSHTTVRDTQTTEVVLDMPPKMVVYWSDANKDDRVNAVLSYGWWVYLHNIGHVIIYVHIQNMKSGLIKVLGCQH